MFEVAIVCVTALVGIVLVLKHLEKFKTERKEFLDNLRTDLLAKVDTRLSEQANYRKDLEVVNSNQLKLAQELELLKKTQQLKTSFGNRPPGSIV